MSRIRFAVSTVWTYTAEGSSYISKPEEHDQRSDAASVGGYLLV